MTSEEKLAFGKRIKALREEKGVSQSEFANYLGVTHSCVANWEGGLRIPDINLWGRIAGFFNVSIDYLCCRSNQKNYIGKRTSNKKSEFAIDISILNPYNQKMLKKYYDFLLRQENDDKKA
ncbi:MAG: helix-turn-helix domain-containing protein [Clostridia bacterium]|nr:helix-turn-helix domain-containing protein [Clostridia bacterium]